MELHMNNEEWQFVEGAWTEDEAGIITAPGNLGDENLAFYTSRAYADFEAEWEFRWDVTWGNAGLVFRARDAQHYYMVHFPVVGQHYRAEHFWACISKVGENGFVEVLNMEMVHGVSSTQSLWHKVRVVMEGNEIRVWVDGRPLSVVKDDTYSEPGYVGLSTYCTLETPVNVKSSFRNLRIRGQEAQAPAWDPAVQPVRNWFNIPDAVGTACGNMVRAPNGELLLTTDEGMVVRSPDDGRTWRVPEGLPKGLAGGWGMGRLYTTPEGVLTMIGLDCYDYVVSHYPEGDEQQRIRGVLSQGEPPYRIMRSTSEDNGRTWSEPVQTGEIVFPPEQPIRELYTSRLLQLQDGTLLLFLWGRTEGGAKVNEGRAYHSMPPPGYVQMCIRSTDDGQSWSEPANLDGPPYTGPFMIDKDHRTEISAAQTREGKIITLTRPYASPWMWESWSEDGGRTWTPTARGPFFMAASDNSMLTTASGAIIIGGRMPGLAVQVSYDDGMTWKCYRIDTACYANGSMYEVEPDLVLYAYGGKYLTKEVSKQTASELRAQFLRITPDGVEPARELMPSE